MAIEPIKGFYVHDEETNTDGIAKFSSEELEDIRVGADGVTYASAGGAVRKQVGCLRDEVFYFSEYTTDSAGSRIFPFEVSNGDTIKVISNSSQPMAVAFRETANGSNLQDKTIPANSTVTYKATTDGAYTRVFFNEVATVKIFNLTKGYVGKIRELVKLYTSAETKALDVLVPFHAKGGDTLWVYSADGSTMTPQKMELYTETGYANIDVNLSGFGYGRLYGLSNSAPEITQVKLVGGTAQDVIVLNLSTFTGNFIKDTNDRLSVLESQKITNIVNKYISNETALDRGNVQENSDFNCLFFSDVHASQVNVERIISFANAMGSSTINTIINGGDIANSLITEDLSWYTTLANGSDVDILDCLGNHDVWETSWVNAQSTVPYSKLIAPMVERVSNIVQPASASENGLCYYYKDYGNIRVIVLVAMWYDSNSVYWTDAQKTWLETVLADAKTNNKSVICVNHAPFGKSTAKINEDLPLNSWRDYFTTPTIDPIQLAQGAVDAVHTFIQNGGEFICWLTGHVHQDMVMTEETYNDQFMINVATARYNYHVDGYSPSATMTFDGAFDCFDYIGVDTSNKMLKVWRVGFNEDASMRIRNRFAYDYSNRKLLSYS